MAGKGASLKQHLFRMPGLDRLALLCYKSAGAPEIEEMHERYSFDSFPRQITVAVSGSTHLESFVIIFIPSHISRFFD